MGMFKTHTVGTHEIKRVKNSYCTSYGNMSIGPYYRCLRCGETGTDMYSGWRDESCREYLQKQVELDTLSSTNPARQKKLQNLTFEEVFDGCGDPVEYLTRRSVTVDTHHATIPEEWGDRDAKRRSVSHSDESSDGLLQRILSVV